METLRRADDLQYDRRAVDTARVSEYFEYALVLISHKEFKSAKDLLQAALVCDPVHPELLRWLCRVERSLGDQQNVIAVAKRLAAVGESEAFFALGEAYYLSGRDELALPSYLEYLNQPEVDDSTFFDAYKNIGNIFVRAGDFDAAEEYYNKAYTLNQRSDVLFVNFGTLEIQREKFDLALERFQQALSINPYNDKARIGVALIHHALGDFELAWANLLQAAECCPENPTITTLSIRWAVVQQNRSYAEAILKITAGEGFAQALSSQLLQLWLGSENETSGVSQLVRRLDEVQS